MVGLSGRALGEEGAGARAKGRAGHRCLAWGGAWNPWMAWLAGPADGRYCGSAAAADRQRPPTPGSSQSCRMLAVAWQSAGVGCVMPKLLWSAPMRSHGHGQDAPPDSACTATPHCLSVRRPRRRDCVPGLWSHSQRLRRRIDLRRSSWMAPPRCGKVPTRRASPSERCCASHGSSGLSQRTPLKTYSPAPSGSLARLDAPTLLFRTRLKPEACTHQSRVRYRAALMIQ
jgi:hypothetical protein